MTFGHSKAPAEVRGQYRTTETDWSRVAPYIRFRYERASALLPAAGNVVELGCGIGVGLDYLARSRPDLQFIGYEMSPEAVNFGSEEFRNTSNLKLRVLENLEQLKNELESNSFLVALEVLEHLPDSALEIFKRDVMKKVRRAVFSFPYDQKNIEGTDHLQSFTIYDIFEIFPGFQTVFIRRKSLKFIGYWERQPRDYVRERLGVGGEAQAIGAIANCSES